MAGENGEERLFITEDEQHTCIHWTSWFKQIPVYKFRTCVTSGSLRLSLSSGICLQQRGELAKHIPAEFHLITKKKNQTKVTSQDYWTFFSHYLSLGRTNRLLRTWAEGQRGWWLWTRPWAVTRSSPEPGSGKTPGPRSLRDEKQK